MSLLSDKPLKEESIMTNNIRKIRTVIFLSCGIILGILCGKSVSVSAEEKVTVGTNAEYAPFEYLDSDGKLTGFDYELLEAIAEEENLELVWKDMPFDSLIGSMEAGDIKIIAAAVGPTKEREKSIIYLRHKGLLMTC